MNTLTVFDLLTKLQQAQIHYELGNYRENAVAVRACVPGEEWEIEFFEDGHVEIEIYRSDGQVFRDERVLDRLFSEFSDESTIPEC